MLFVGSIWGAPPGMPGRLSLSAYIDAFSSPYTYKVIANSFFLSFVKTTLATIWGVVLAWLVTRTDVPLRRTMEVLIPVQFFIPAIFNALAYLMLLNPHSGIVNQLFMGAFGLESAPFNLLLVYRDDFCYGARVHGVHLPPNLRSVSSVRPVPRGKRAYVRRRHFGNAPTSDPSACRSGDWRRFHLVVHSRHRGV